LALSAGDSLCEDPDTMRTDTGDELAIEALRRHGRLTIRVRGGSMAPFIRDGDIVTVSEIAPSAPGIGDVICYETTPRRLFVHRVVACDGQRLFVKGDALTFTEVVERDQVLGKVVALERRGTLRRLDTAAARWRNRAIATLSPAIPRLLPMALLVRRAWRAVRG
jgi:hypothetical protein